MSEEAKVVTVEEMEARLAQLREAGSGPHAFACDFPILGRLARDSSEIRMGDWPNPAEVSVYLWDKEQGAEVVWVSFEGWADENGSFAIRWLGRLMQERENGAGPYRTPPPGALPPATDIPTKDTAGLITGPLTLRPSPAYEALLDELRGTTGEDDWVQTFSGHQVWIHHPRVQDVAITDIAQHLGKLCRFHGGVREFYSVGHHSVLVSQNVPEELALAALLHDAHEAYLNDLARPLKRFLPLYKELCRRHDRVISEKFFGHPDAFAAPEIKHADNVVLATERRDLMRDGPGQALWDKLETPLPEKIVPLGPDASSRLFIARWIELRHQGIQR